MSNLPYQRKSIYGIAEFFFLLQDRIGVEQLESKPYKLTARIFPSKDQQAIVKRDLLQACKRAEYLSNEAVKVLLIDESIKLSQRTEKKIVQKNRRQSVIEKEDKLCAIQEVVAPTLRHPSDDRSIEEYATAENKIKQQSEEEEESYLHSVLSDSISALTTNQPKMKIDSETKVLVTVGKDEGSNLMKNIGDNPLYPKVAESFSKDRATCSLSADGEKIGSLLNNFLSPLPLAPVVCYSAADSFLHTNQMKSISNLEDDLTEANCQLIEERLAHSNALRKEKKRCEDLIQALQLRLYISENKVRVYEDALETHIQFVSAINSSCYIRKKNDQKRISGSTSLISNFLQKSSGDHQS